MGVVLRRDLQALNLPSAGIDVTANPQLMLRIWTAAAQATRPAEPAGARARL